MIDAQELRLGFVGDRSLFAGDELWTSAGVGRIVNVLRQRCAKVTVALSRSTKRLAFHDHRLDMPREDFLPLPWVPSIARGFFQVRACRRVITEVERRSDVLLVQLPFAAVWALSRPRRPRVYQVCANVRQMVATSNWYRGPKRVAASLAAHVLDRAQGRLIARGDARMIAHGSELADHYGRAHGVATVSSSLLDAEILSLPRRRPADAPFRILFVGFLRHEKGLDTLLAAYRRLLATLPTAELEIIGGRDTVAQGVDTALRREIDALGAVGQIRLRGQLHFGPELFQALADADVLAVPSRSEGTPRVLVEARGFGCTVVGSAVGGIPTSIDDGVNGLLVPPGDPSALAAALARIAGDASLRQRLIVGGIERARRCTVESFAELILEEALRLKREIGSPPQRASLPVLSDSASAR